jgi:hypothetical protein
LLPNFIYNLQGKGNNLPSLPTLIVVPRSDAFVNQWKDALVCSGVPSENIILFARDSIDTLQHESKHSLTTEMRHFLKGRGSVLFPNIPQQTFC